MIQRIVAGALRMPFVVFALAVLLVVVGLVAYKELDIEAYPIPVPRLVEAITQPEDGAPRDRAVRDGTPRDRLFWDAGPRARPVFVAVRI